MSTKPPADNSRIVHPERSCRLPDGNILAHPPSYPVGGSTPALAQGMSLTTNFVNWAKRQIWGSNGDASIEPPNHRVRDWPQGRGPGTPGAEGRQFIVPPCGPGTPTP